MALHVDFDGVTLRWTQVAQLCRLGQHMRFYNRVITGVLATLARNGCEIVFRVSSEC